MQQGVVLMVVGMGVVFCFLVLLVFAVKVMGAVLRNVATAEPAPSAAPQLSLRRMTQQLLLLLQQSDSVRAESLLFLYLNF